MTSIRCLVNIFDTWLSQGGPWVQRSKNKFRRISVKSLATLNLQWILHPAPGSVSHTLRFRKASNYRLPSDLFSPSTLRRVNGTLDSTRDPDIPSSGRSRYHVFYNVIRTAHQTRMCIPYAPDYPAEEILCGASPCRPWKPPSPPLSQIVFPSTLGASRSRHMYNGSWRGVQNPLHICNDPERAFDTPRNGSFGRFLTCFQDLVNVCGNRFSFVQMNECLGDSAPGEDHFLGFSSNNDAPVSWNRWSSNFATLAWVFPCFLRFAIGILKFQGGWGLTPPSSNCHFWIRSALGSETLNLKHKILSNTFGVLSAMVSICLSLLRCRAFVVSLSWFRCCLLVRCRANRCLSLSRFRCVSLFRCRGICCCLLFRCRGVVVIRCFVVAVSLFVVVSLSRLRCFSLYRCRSNRCVSWLRCRCFSLSRCRGFVVLLCFVVAVSLFSLLFVVYRCFVVAVALFLVVSLSRFRCFSFSRQTSSSYNIRPEFA